MRRRTDQIPIDENPGSSRPLVRQWWRLWAMRLILALLAPMVFLAAEAGLRLCGYGCAQSFLIRRASGTGYTTNDKFARRYYGKSTILKPLPFIIPQDKPPGTVRICILGESAAMGNPDPAFGFGRILDLELRQSYPERRIEVFNAAMPAINSPVVRTIAAECARHGMDAFVVYLGNNEHAPEANSARWRRWLPLLRLADWLRATRLGQLFVSVALEHSEAPKKLDMAYFRSLRMRADDPQQAKVIENTRANLDDICRLARHAGIKVILSTVAVNLADSAPLGSMHRANLGATEQKRWDDAVREGAAFESNGECRQAISRYRAAADIDDHFAELRYRLGRCYTISGEASLAQKEYAAACDWDALQFRSDSRINSAIRDCAHKWQNQGVFLVDNEKAFAQSGLSKQGIPGAALFQDHVHPTFAGTYLVATNCLPALTHALASVLGKPTPNRPLDERQCADAIAYTPFDELCVLSANIRLTSSPPFLDQLEHSRAQAAAEADLMKRLATFGRQQAELCVRTYEDALLLHPDDWQVRYNFTSLLAELGRHEEAVKNLKVVVNTFPDRAKFRVSLANELMNLKERDAALAQLKLAQRADPDDIQVQQALAALLRAPGKQ